MIDWFRQTEETFQGISRIIHCMPDMYVPVAEYLRSARHRANLEQTQLAALLGVGQTAITNWERASALPAVERISSIAAALGCDEEELRGLVRQAIEARIGVKMAGSSLSSGQALALSIRDRFASLEADLADLRLRVEALESAAG